MADTDYPVNSPLAVKLWARKLFQEALKQTWMYRFIGESSDHLVQHLTDTSKGPGDRITVGLRMQLSGAGVEGDGTLEGNEEALTTYTDNLLINQLRHAVRSNGRMSEQRVPFSLREEARIGLQDWFSDRIDTAIFNQLGGDTGVGDTRYTGHNTATAPTSNGLIYPNGLSSEASVVSASASNAFSISFIDDAVEKAKTNTPAIRPLKIMGEDYYVMFLHPFQVRDLRASTAAAGSWFDIQKAAITGGEVTNNPIFNGALGVHNRVILHESTRVPSVTANAYRAILCGAQAAVVGFGQDNSPNRMTWNEETFDYGNKLGVSAGLIWGAKKCVFNSQDFATVVIPTYAAAHTG